jgi:hypothetical protein
MRSLAHRALADQAEAIVAVARGRTGGAASAMVRAANAEAMIARLLLELAAVEDEVEAA